jgi:hypothetical protein
MPLVYVGRGEENPITAVHEKARKVKPQYLGGDLVKVAFASNLAEAELLQGILLEEGIPTVQRRTRGFDVPDFLAAGPRDILAPQAAERAARSLLADVDAETGEDQIPPPGAGETRPLNLVIGLLIALAIAGAIVYGLYQVAT